ncbi:MAG TPA: PIN domain nuclease [Steroidobacteraceae bacterium]|nr:PIN domain nuclease [Steroidobacteraceae bacterium]
MIVVDSSVWIDYFNGTESPGAERLDGLLGVARLAVGDLVLAEVLQGFRDDDQYRVAKQTLTSLTVLEMLGQKMAVRSAENYRSLRARGITIRKTVDVLIATYCIEHDLPLLFDDKDFLPFVRYLGLKEG